MSKTLDAYKAGIDKVSGVELKGKNMLYTSSNGYMFSLINKDDELGIRLSPEDYKNYREKFQTDDFKSYGATMREYVRIPESTLQDTKTISALLKKGYDYVNSLPPK